MATRRRAAPRSGARRRRTFRWPKLSIPADVARSLVGLTLLIVGVFTLVAMALPGQGRLTDWWRDVIAPWFGTGRWLLPFVLLAAGAYVEWRRPAANWQRTLLGLAITYIGVLAFIQLLDSERGGRIGHAVASTLITLVTYPGAMAAVLAIILAGLVVALETTVASLLGPVWNGVRGFATTALSSSKGSGTVGGRGEPTRPGQGGRTRGIPSVVSPGQTGVWSDGRNGGSRDSILDQPAPRSSSMPMSQTVWAGHDHAGGEPVGTGHGGDGGNGHSGSGVPVFGGPGGATGAPAGAGGAMSLSAAAPAAVAVADMAGSEPSVIEELHAIPWSLPTVDLLEERAPGRGAAGPDAEANRHAWNIRRIEEKLLSFQIPAKVVATNTGPVVTQYEVRPDAHVKLSRIEALADDLAMALAARSIRIEAPIPGKDVVGIEIPNHASEVVGFRPLLEDAAMLAAPSRLMFALGRDVSGQPYAVDLAKMPHLLIAGATGSGKSVCVNAVITSILMHAKPHEVRLVLVDLKRVELAAYDRLPHLLQHVITEPHEAKAVLNWAVHEMEQRYKILASHTVRNVAAYNALETLPEYERLPYIVIVVDELADLIMREGRKVEDPVVKIAQKARAVGIHLVLATQRPSVNVVTGLIKANVPSRIAFAMASMVDSRTVLDQPGAEDLLGRGDMLYQPVDLPRPVRLQGVFVSDREVGEVTSFWREQATERTFYDDTIFEYVDVDSESGNGGQFAWLAKIADDDMVVRAAELVTSTGRASTSMLQTKLKVGFARASRLTDELERYGIIGPQDPRNPATPRAVYGSENWLRSLDDADDPGD